MGVLNVTPDSFSDGGAYLTVEHALHPEIRGHTTLELPDDGSPGDQTGSEHLGRRTNVVLSQGRF